MKYKLLDKVRDESNGKIYEIVGFVEAPFRRSKERSDLVPDITTYSNWIKLKCIDTENDNQSVHVSVLNNEFTLYNNGYREERLNELLNDMNKDETSEYIFDKYLKDECPICDSHVSTESFYSHVENGGKCMAKYFECTNCYSKYTIGYNRTRQPILSEITYKQDII